MSAASACYLDGHIFGGADTRLIRQMLGQAELSTTQIYTQVSLRKLAAIHTVTHPGATDERHRSPTKAGGEGEREAVGELLQALDAEEAAEAPAGDQQGSNPPPSGATLKRR